jgi:hypothetical protein
MHKSYIEKLALVLSQEAVAHSLAGCAITESSQLPFALGGMST